MVSPERTTHPSDTRAIHRFFFPNPASFGADDSVVIEVEKTEFRLHQPTLQKKSAYFAALFARSGGWAYLDDETDERSRPVYWVRGPVHRVAETTADDFATLLIVIEEPMCVPTSVGEIAVAYCTFCVAFDRRTVLGNTQMRYHRCPSWLVFSALRMHFLLKQNVNGRSVSWSVCGRRSWIPSQRTQSHMRLPRLSSLAPTICAVSKSAQVTSYYECRRSSKSSSSLLW